MTQPVNASSSPGAVRKRPTLAAVLMVKNEESRLAACLDRVAGWADEIVIIDDHSQDRTVEIARRYTDKIFSYASNNDHCLQWNRGSDHATADWILHIDADEWVSPPLKEAIDAALSSNPTHQAFELMRLNFFLGHPMRHGGWYHKHLILYRREGTRCVGSGIHTRNRLQFKGTMGFIDCAIEHYPFSSIHQFVDRQNLYSTVEAQALFRDKGRLPMRTILHQSVIRPFKFFWKSYVKQQGYKEGWHGCAFALLSGFSHFIYWIKYWELAYGKDA